MFESLELGRRIPRKEFKPAETELRRQLLALQYELVKRPFSVLVIVSGVEGAGKGTVVHRFNKWMDPRLIDTHAFWDPSDEETRRPYHWRFWRAMPAKGRIGVFFGSWYTKPIVDAALGRCEPEQLDNELQRINDLEKTLATDGTLIIKLWFHISQKHQARQLAADEAIKLRDLHVTYPVAKFAEHYDAFARTSERAIRRTDQHHAPWHLVEAHDPYYRDLTAGRILLRALQGHLDTPRPPANGIASVDAGDPSQPTVLDTVRSDARLSEDRYKRRLNKLQGRLQELAWAARQAQVATVAVFEGWDAAGKGSAIRRVTEAVDPRLFRLLQYAAPTDEERAQHYLWRFWRQLARDGKFTLFDRSWYGRVLVERVEGFATPDEWQRAYPEINRFEEQLCEHGSVVMKFWIHIDQDEQLERFRLREVTPHKQHKITPEDWRNRDKWDDYKLAVHDMVTHTSTQDAPWTLVAGNDKKYARVQILETFCERLEAALAARAEGA